MALSNYITRELERPIKQAARDFPVIALTGPRQSGKTTLLNHLFSKTHRYLSMDRPDIRQAAQHDPKGFFTLYPPPVLLDEIQYAPELLSYIKNIVDQHRDHKGQFILTGSQNFAMSQQISESLAGRVAMLTLLPLSFREITGRINRPALWEIPFSRSNEPENNDSEQLWPFLRRGGYPELIREPHRDAQLWHSSYIQTYLERDLRSLRQVGDLGQFQIFMRALAARNGQLLNLTELGNELGLVTNTVKAWISILETSYQILLLRPWFTNTGKRLVKTPKLYFTDPGTLSYFAGIQSKEHILSLPQGGALFETAVIMEIIKYFRNLGREPRVYFWRTSTAQEVDLIVESGPAIIPIEIKLSSTPRPKMADSIRALLRDQPQIKTGYVIHTGPDTLPLGDQITAIPFGRI